MYHSPYDYQRALDSRLTTVMHAEEIKRREAMEPTGLHPQSGNKEDPNIKPTCTYMVGFACILQTPKSSIPRLKGL